MFLPDGKGIDFEIHRLHQHQRAVARRWQDAMRRAGIPLKADIISALQHAAAGGSPLPQFVYVPVSRQTERTVVWL